MGLGSEIRDWDPGVKKAPDPGAKSATLLVIYNPFKTRLID
jgi:hypothetical protein